MWKLQLVTGRLSRQCLTRQGQVILAPERPDQPVTPGDMIDSTSIIILDSSCSSYPIFVLSTTISCVDKAAVSHTSKTNPFSSARPCPATCAALCSIVLRSLPVLYILKFPFYLFGFPACMYKYASHCLHHKQNRSVLMTSSSLPPSNPCAHSHCVSVVPPLIWSLSHDFLPFSSQFCAIEELVQAFWAICDANQERPWKRP